ncbi:solute carrier family 12 member 8-like protein [Leptotrombidium deliense]|uniref:Solute carrier family 12 member 8-like protein n=1 Tax=Leptotrombidium deliense TaxID=299467 RepID=A0A443SDP7_9ACAR|nr:solute carrier family 12 member 8-like protein [Leptotrombidium deliense]
MPMVGEQSEKSKWSRFGLEKQSTSGALADDEAAVSSLKESFQNEIYRESQLNSKPWWKTQFFLVEPVLFGTWDGVYTSCVIHLFGVITFLRMGWIVGNAGIGLTVLVILCSVAICTLSVTSAIKISERCMIPGSGGNVHSLLSYVLGARFGGAVSIVYCFGKAVSCALHAVGFAESISVLLQNETAWIQRSIGMSLILALFFINVAGVKWVVRLQFTLLIVLLFAALDFAVGIFVTFDPAHGVIGYSTRNFENNLSPQYESKVNIFDIFGVFFPATIGVFSGVNMSGDLYSPQKSLSRGTYAAIATTTCLYLLFALGLGSVCLRSALLTNYMIEARVSAIGYFLLAGLYISSVSYCLGSMYASPRIIQHMAQEGIIPAKNFLSQGKGPNKVPASALILFSIIVCGFITIRQINVLATIVTIPFLLTYAVVEYAYFSFCMTIEMQLDYETKFQSYDSLSSPTFFVSKPSKHTGYGTLKGQDLDRLFPERVQSSNKTMKRQQSSPDQSDTSMVTSPDDHSSIRSVNESVKSAESEASPTPTKNVTLLKKTTKGLHYRICGLFTSKYTALISALVKIIIMFLVHWLYSLLAFIAVIFFWFYIGHINAGYNPGITQFDFFKWIKYSVLKIFGKSPKRYEQVIIASSNPEVEVTATQVTEEGTDFSSREKYHQATTVSSIKEVSVTK